ncbi:S24 family peptidase [uncultured Bilophila sp.]|uniref:XRE family transcriptional regulator n=1 Tax=uncultured Bilophila sp. TaxID=529385 RepID=UPI0025DDE991|nr:S24 family peptidase [uncultured Bilophila sp.]
MKFSEKFYELLREKNKERGWQSAFAKRAGISQSALSKIISGETKAPELASVAAIVDALGEELFFSPTIRRTGINSPEEPAECDHSVTVGIYAAAGAGPAIDIDQGELLYNIKVPAEYAARSDCALAIKGDSMCPTIKNGGVVGIQRENFDFASGELYAVRLPYEGLAVKRIIVDASKGEYVIRSDNPDKERYPDMRLGIEESPHLILGRVVWIWQIL